MANRTFNDHVSLQKAIEIEINNAMNKVGDVLLELLKEYIQKYWYDLYPEPTYPLEYIRTYDFLERAPIKLEPIQKGNSFTVGVYLEPENLRQDTVSSRNNRYSINRHNYEGNGREQLIQDMMDGSYEMRPVDNVNITQIIIDDFFKNGEYVKVFMAALKSAGLEIN